MIGNPWCLNPFCHRHYRDTGVPTNRSWWEDYGTCGRACAETYYGADVVDGAV